MALKKILAIITVLAVLTLSDCSKKEEKCPSPAPAAKTQTQVAVKEAKKEFFLPREFQTSKFSDNTKWFNGINRQEKNQFFFTIDKNDPTPFMPGFKLEFAKSGEAVIVNVYRLDNPDNANIFITLDKNLDPVGDGYPNHIYVRSLQIQTSKYSQENVWRSGISLNKPGMFFFMVEKKTYIPFNPGDRLKFTAAGEAVITAIYRSEKQEKFSQVFITVDKPLDPVGDGTPNLIEKIF
jgi:hypothetical protein